MKHSSNMWIDNTPYPSRKIRRICAYTSLKTTKEQDPIRRIQRIPIRDIQDIESDEIEPTNEKPSNLEETNHDDEQEIDEIFRIETNLFDYETPLREKFKEFNYILKIDPDLLTKDIEGFKTYEDYKDGWIYEWNEDIPWRNDGYCNGGKFHGAYIVGNSLYYKDYEWYEALKDSKLKDEALRNKAIMEGLIKEVDESSGEYWRSSDNFDNTNDDRNKWDYENEH
ncbi:hypothetical protein Tco_0172642 [Tanacetum coccineum]